MQRTALLYFLERPDEWHPMSHVGRSHDVQKALNALVPTYLERTTIGTLRDQGHTDPWTRDPHFRPEAPAYRVAQRTRDAALGVLENALRAFVGTPQWDDFVFTRAFQFYLNHHGVRHLCNLFGRFALGLRAKLDCEIVQQYLGERYEAHLVAKATLACLHASESMEQFWPCWERQLREYAIPPFPAYFAVGFARWQHFIDLIYFFRTCPTAIAQSLRGDPISLKARQAWVQFGDKPKTNEPTHFVYAWCSARVHEWWRDDHLRNEQLQSRLGDLFPGGGSMEERVTHRLKSGKTEFHVRWSILPAAKMATVEIEPSTGLPIIRTEKWKEGTPHREGTVPGTK